MKDSHRLTTQNTGTLKKWYFCFCCHLFCSWFQIIPCLYQSLLCLYPGEFSALILLQQAFLLWRLSDRLSYSGEFDVRRFYSSRNNWTLEKLKGIHELKHVYTSHMRLDKHVVLFPLYHYSSSKTHCQCLTFMFPT